METKENKEGTEIKRSKESEEIKWAMVDISKRISILDSQIRPLAMRRKALDNAYQELGKKYFDIMEKLNPNYSGD